MPKHNVCQHAKNVICTKMVKTLKTAYNAFVSGN